MWQMSCIFYTCCRWKYEGIVWWWQWPCPPSMSFLVILWWPAPWDFWLFGSWKLWQIRYVAHIATSRQTQRIGLKWEHLRANSLIHCCIGFFNLLTPANDQHVISPYIMSVIKHKIHKNKQSDHKRWIALLIEQILQTFTIRHKWSLVRRILKLVPGVGALPVMPPSPLHPTRLLLRHWKLAVREVRHLFP